MSPVWSWPGPACQDHPVSVPPGHLCMLLLHSSSAWSTAEKHSNVHSKCWVYKLSKCYTCLIQDQQVKRLFKNTDNQILFICWHPLQSVPAQVHTGSWCWVSAHPRDSWCLSMGSRLRLASQEAASGPEVVGWKAVDADLQGRDTRQ